MYINLNDDDPKDLKEAPKDLRFRGFDSDNELSDVADMYVDLNEDDPMDLKDDPKDLKEDPKDLKFRGFDSDDEVSDVADMCQNENKKDDPIDLSVPFPVDMNRCLNLNSV